MRTSRSGSVPIAVLVVVSIGLRGHRCSEQFYTDVDLTGTDLSGLALDRVDP